MLALPHSATMGEGGDRGERRRKEEEEDVELAGEGVLYVAVEEGKTPTGGWKIQARHTATMRPKDGWRLTPLPLALGEASTLFQAKCRYVRDTACPVLRPQHVCGLG